MWWIGVDGEGEGEEGRGYLGWRGVEWMRMAWDGTPSGCRSALGSLAGGGATSGKVVGERAFGKGGRETSRCCLPASLIAINTNMGSRLDISRISGQKRMLQLLLPLSFHLSHHVARLPFRLHCTAPPVPGS